MLAAKIFAKALAQRNMMRIIAESATRCRAGTWLRLNANATALRIEIDRLETACPEERAERQEVWEA